MVNPFHVGRSGGYFPYLAVSPGVPNLFDILFPKEPSACLVIPPNYWKKYSLVFSKSLPADPDSLAGFFEWVEISCFVIAVVPIPA